MVESWSCCEIPDPVSVYKEVGENSWLDKDYYALEKI